MRRADRGFTLIEAVVSIVILGIIAGMAAVFIRAPIDAYVDTARRVALTEAADSAIRRMVRDIQAALPNSFRAPADGSNQCFEFLPVIAGGRYRVEQQGIANPQGNVLNFTAADSAFDVLGSVGLNRLDPVSHVVIYNLGVAGANAYATPAQNRAEIGAVGAGAGGAAQQITLAAPFRFPFESPSRRFQVIANASVVYYCDAASGAVRRTTRALANASAAMATCPAPNLNDPILVANVVCGGADSAFVYVPANATREGWVEIMMTLTDAGESIRLYDRVSVNNAP